MTGPQDASNLEVVLVEGDARRAEAYAIRVDVFVNEQGVPPELELDDLDAGADHILLVLDGVAVATGRLVVEEPGYEGLDPRWGQVAHLGRIAVTRVHRSRGFGAAVVRELETLAAQRGLRVAYLGAQSYARPFYERLGYTAYGPPFDDAGIEHRHMTRSLADA